jgi:hypothetical protein
MGGYLVGERFMPTAEMMAGAQDVAPLNPAQPKRFMPTPDMMQQAVPVEPKFQHTYRESTAKVVKAPYGLTPQEIEDYDDFENYEPSSFEAYFLDPVMRGVSTADQSVAAGAYLSGLISDEYAGKTLMDQELKKRENAAPPGIQKDMETILLSKDFGDAFKNIVKHPAGFYNLMLESAVSSIPGMTVGMAFGPSGSGVKAAVGRGAAFGAGSAVQEYASGLLDMMGKRDIDMTNEAAVRGVLNDGEFMKEARARGMKRGAIIGMIDALSAGMAGKIGGAVGGGVKGAATEVGAQALSGAGGEALGQVATDGGITSPAEILLEGAAEGISGIPEIAMGREGGKVRVPKTGEQPPSLGTGIPTEPMDVVGAEPNVAEDVVASSPVYDERTIFNLTPDELEIQERQSTMSDDDKLVEALGEEKAALFKKLDRKQNSMNPDVADKAAAEMDDLTANLTPEQERLIYGIGETGATAEDFKELRQAHSFSEFDPDQSVTEIAASTANAMMGVDPLAVMNVPQNGGSIKEQGAFIRITKGIKALRARGVPKEQIAEELVKGMVSRGNTQSNAAEIVGNFIEKIEQNAGPSQPAIAAPEMAALPSPASGGGQGGQPPTGAPPAASSPDPDRESDYAKVAQMPPPKPPSSLNALVQDVGDMASDWLVPMSTRLGNIHQSIKHAVRKFTFNVGLHTTQDKAVAEPFIEGVSDKFSTEDYRILDLALKNGDAAKTDELMTKYGLTEEYAKVRALLEKIHTDAKVAGMEIGYLENYFPRQVHKGKATDYIAFLQGQKEWSLIEQAMRKEDPNNTMTAEEQADFANLWLRGYKNDNLKLSRSGNTKERTVDYVTPEGNQYYKDSMQTLIDYIGGMRYTIETHKLFGKSEKDTDENIGSYVLQLIDQGIISRDQELELRKILKAVVNPTGTHGAMTALKNVSYIYTMGSPISAITQLGDLAFTLFKNGYYFNRTLSSIAKAATGNAAMTREDVGISDILTEFEDNSKSGNAVRKVFGLVGLARMDKFGKEVFMDSAIQRLRADAQKASPAFVDQMEMIFGDEAQTVIEDLKTGRKTENVRYLAYSELADFQPISIAEMPVTYANSGNGRILYMLKSYTIKQLDVYRREIFKDLGGISPIDVNIFAEKGKKVVRKKVEADRTAKALKNFIGLGASLMLMGMSADALKDLLLGREIELDDLVMDNVLKTMGFTKYQIYTSQKDGYFRTFWTSLFVPAAIADDITRDVYDLATDEKDMDEVRAVSGVPIVGKFYYWWEGAGSDD